MAVPAIEGPRMARTRPHRLTVDVDSSLYEALSTMRFTDHLSNAERIRALLELANEDQELAQRVVQKASELMQKT